MTKDNAIASVSADDAQMELFEDADLAGLAARETGPIPAKAAPPIGIKFDTGKPMFDCIDPVGLMELGKVAAFGAQQYGHNNWQAVPNGRSRYINAGLRHVLRGLAGEYLDPESKTPHFVVAAWNFLAAAWFERRAHNN